MMKTIKILLKAAVLSLVCANAVAIGMRSTADVKEAIDQTIAQLEKAVAAFDKNNNDKAVIDLLMEAKQTQKSISSANGQLSMIKSRATQKLGLARSRFNDGDAKVGGGAMKEALAGFKELKEKYNAVH
jgi:galactitol-specific phosphotransferase system IIB component